MTAGSSAETEISNSRRQVCPLLLQEVAKGEKVRRRGAQRGPGRGDTRPTSAPSRWSAEPPKAPSRRAPRRAQGRCALAAARSSCSEQRRRWAVAAAGRIPAPGPRPESPRSETRPRRALRSPARRAHVGQRRGTRARGSPPRRPPPHAPFPFYGRALPAAAPPGRPYAAREKSAPAPASVSGTRLPPALLSVPVPQAECPPFTRQWNSLNSPGRLQPL